MADRPAFTTFDINMEVGPAKGPLQPRADSPFRTLVIGDLTGRGNRGVNEAASLSTRKLVAIDRDNFDDVLERLRPSLELRLGSADAAPTTIAFWELDDFHPDRLFERVELFEQLRRMRRRLMNKEWFADAAAELTAGRIASVSAPEEMPVPKPVAPPPIDVPTGGLLDAALAATEDSAAAAAAANPIERVIQQIVAPYIEKAADPRQPEFVAAVDDAIGEQMRQLLHHPEFQALEAAWRGLYLLVRRLETDANLKLQLLDVSPVEIAADFADRNDLSQSGLWKLLSDQSIGTPGNDPFACLVALFEVAPNEQSIATFGGLTAIAARLGAPLLAGAHPRFAGCESFAGSPDPDDWTQPLDGDAGKMWQQFRKQPAARFASLIAPRFLLRLPYGKKTDAAESFAFEEMPQTPRHGDYLWGSPSILGGLLLGTGFTEAGWGLRTDASMELDGLPLHVCERDGDRELQPCAEAWLTERSAKALAANGLTPLLSVRDRDAVLLAGLRSAADPAAPLAGAWNV
jgi:type VI secretion system protein ImpC